MLSQGGTGISSLSALCQTGRFAFLAGDPCIVKVGRQGETVKDTVARWADPDVRFKPLSVVPVSLSSRHP